MFFSGKPQEEFVLILDVQSSVVRGSLVLLKASAAPVIFFTDSLEVPYKARATSGYLIKVTLKIIENIVENVMREFSLRRSEGQFNNLPDKIRAVHYVLSSPWIVSQAKSLSLTFPHDTKINQKKVSDIVADERAKLIGKDGDAVSVIEEKVFDVRLNGYSVPVWQNRYTRALEVSFVVSIAGTRLVERLREACLNLISSRHVYFHSSLLLQQIGIQKSMPERGTYRLMHVHGELTDVIVVKRHICTFFGSYPLGIRTIIRSIADDLHVDQNTAESSLALYENDSLDVSHGQGTLKAISTVATLWIKALETLLKKASVEESLFDTIISARMHGKFFSRVLRAAYPEANVRTLSPEDLQGHVIFAEQVESLPIMGLLAAALQSILYP